MAVVGSFFDRINQVNYIADFSLGVGFYKTPAIQFSEIAGTILRCRFLLFPVWNGLLSKWRADTITIRDENEDGCCRVRREEKFKYS